VMLSADFLERRLQFTGMLVTQNPENSRSYCTTLRKTIMKQAI